MPTFELNVNGKTYDVEAPDEKSLPEIADTIAKNELGAQQNSNTDSNDSTKSDNPLTIADKRLADRPSTIRSLWDNPPEIQHPIGGVLRTALGIGEAIQGVPASIAMDLQRVNPNLEGAKQIVGNVGNVLTGQRPAEFGDFLRGTGLNETASKIGGLGLGIVATPGGPKAAEGLVKTGGSVIKAGGKLIQKGASAVGKSGGRIIESFKGPSSLDLKATLAQRKVEISDSINALNNMVREKGIDIVKKAKVEIPKISQMMSKAYGDSLEDIFTRLEKPLEAGSILKKDAPAITNQELVSTLEELVGKTAADPLIVKSEAYKKTLSMLDYFKNGLSSEAGLVDESGNVIKSSAPSSVDIRDLIAKIRDVRNTVASTTKSGSAPVGAKDYFATQFDKSVGNLLKDRVDGFSELQSTFGKMANTRKVAYKLFKPFADEDSATSFLNRIKDGTLKSSDRKVLEFLQNGGSISGKKISGMGDISSDLNGIGNKLKKLKSGDEVRELGARIAKKAADEDFRNKFFLWAAGLGGTGIAGTAKAIHFINKD